MRNIVGRATGALMVIFAAAIANGGVEDGSLGKSREYPFAGDQALARVLFQGMCDARERLRSGSVDIIYVAKHGRSGNSRRDEYHVCFDFDGGRLRFDRRAAKRFTQYAHTPKESLIYVDGSKVLCRHEPSWSIDVSDAKPFDIRGIGLQSLAEFDYRYSFAELRKRLEGLHQVEVVRDGDNIYRWSWEWDARPFIGTQMFWLDEEKGLSPVKMEMRMREPAKEDTSETAKEVGWIEQSSVTQWEERSGTWVPVRWVTCEPRLNNSYEMELTWESVNGVVPDIVFEPEGFELPLGTAIANVRLQEPIIESIVDASNDNAKRAEEATSSIVRPVALSCGFVGILLLVVLLRLRSERQTAGR